MKAKLPNLETCKITVIGLGYVGLPLIVEFAKTNRDLLTKKDLSRKLIGFDINKKRVVELNNNIDKTKEIIPSDLIYFKDIIFSHEEEIIIDSDVFIVTVPTPIDKARIPNLVPLKNASKLIGESLKNLKKYKNFKKDTIPLIIFESTVFPGATEEECVPIIEKYSGLELNNGFCVGYSPERINPGDKKHRLPDIVKITSGSSEEASLWIDNLYGSIIRAGTFNCSSIKVAEAAKVIENTQRDLNIALVNELSIIFKKLDIDTLDVLEAASTKWNFLKFKPGLVGGHCIGVDPYYLTYKAQQVNYSPQIVLSGRRINDSMGEWISEQLIKKMANNNLQIGNANVLIMGLTFKENCPDLRNSKVLDVVKTLKEYNLNCFVYDHLADKSEAKNLYSLEVKDNIEKDLKFSAIIIAVAHDLFKNKSPEFWQSKLVDNGVIFDLKGILPKSKNIIRL